MANAARRPGLLTILSSAASGPIPNAWANANARMRTIIAFLRLFIRRKEQHGDASRGGTSRGPCSGGLSCGFFYGVRPGRTKCRRQLLTYSDLQTGAVSVPGLQPPEQHLQLSCRSRGRSRAFEASFRGIRDASAAATLRVGEAVLAFRRASGKLWKAGVRGCRGVAA
jgi:hypothetical protein